MTCDIAIYAMCHALSSSKVLATGLQPLLATRGYHRILKLARTIADLAGVERVGSEYVAEALQYRPRQVLA